MNKLFHIGMLSGRVFGLDLMRFIAISLVLISHGRVLISPILKDKQSNFTIGGFLGVELFFVLSGFLIGGILIKICEKDGGLNVNSLKDFWKRRWFRTLPNYYLIIIVTTLVALLKGKHLFTSPSYYLYFIFCQNFAYKPSIDFFFESWSLAVEEWFYLTLPIVFIVTFFCIDRFNFRVKTSNKSLISILVLLFLGFIFRLVGAYFTDLSWFIMRCIVLFRLDSIVWGVLFAWVNFYRPVFFKKYSIHFAIAAFILLVHCVHHYWYQYNTPGHLTDFYSRSLYFTIINVAFAALLPLVSSWNSTKYTSISSLITKVSICSYSIYLTHITFSLNFVLALRKSNFPIIKDFDTNAFSSIVSFIIYVIISVSISILLFKYFERPMTDLRDKKNTNSKALKKQYS
ncbi:acyltransferase [Mucilaginibacter gynuensis]|uniref:acyltransferase family protein n=1 Tax=Mucilaginibacter gynuensis TaxID=1302236 RepID=UPI0031E7AB39